MGASKLGGRAAEIGWKFSEVASSKVHEVSGTVRKVNFIFLRLFALCTLGLFSLLNFFANFILFFILLIYLFSHFCFVLGEGRPACE